MVAFLAKPDFIFGLDWYIYSLSKLIAERHIFAYRKLNHPDACIDRQIGKWRSDT
jgi:hypothetical protein